MAQKVICPACKGLGKAKLCGAPFLPGRIKKCSVCKGKGTVRNHANFPY